MESGPKRTEGAELEVLVFKMKYSLKRPSMADGALGKDFINQKSNSEREGKK